jgi:heat shock protein HslJ
MGDFGRLARGAAAALIALAMTGASMAQDGIRMIDGSLTYRERMALPEDALAVIEARDARGRLLGEATLRTRGTQVPVGFQIAVPAGLEAELRAAFVIGGRPAWYVSDIAVSAGTDPVALGEIVLSRFIPMGFASTYRCGERELSVGFFDANAVIEVDDVRTVLEPVPAASGARFEAPGDPGTWVWNRGDTVTVSLGGDTLPECSVVPPEAPRPYRAQGNEPGWTLSIVEGRVTLIADYGARTIEAALPEAAFENGAFTYRMPAEALELRLAPGLCRDDMTGMPYPETVTVTLAGAALTGCGGDPLELLGGEEWVVEDIAGRGIVGGSRVTLAFAEDGGLSGTASCNRYAAGVTIGGEGVSVGQIAATRKMCPEALMDQEGAFFAALASVGRFDIGTDGALLLYDPASPDPALTARR